MHNANDQGALILIGVRHNRISYANGSDTRFVDFVLDVSRRAVAYEFRVGWGDIYHN